MTSRPAAARNNSRSGHQRMRWYRQLGEETPLLIEPIGKQGGCNRHFGPIVGGGGKCVYELGHRYASMRESFGYYEFITIWVIYVGDVIEVTNSVHLVCC